MSIDCFDCGKELKPGDKAYEFTAGTFTGEYVIAEESLETWCESCEMKRSDK